jgi:hypothetical protein
MAPNGWAVGNSVNQSAHVGRREARPRIELVKEHDSSLLIGVAAQCI